MDNITIPPKRSIKLSEEEKELLKNFYDGFITDVDCALALGIDRNVLARVLLVGSGSETTITRIREKLKATYNNNASLVDMQINILSKWPRQKF